MFYYLTIYSFDNERPVNGPFKSENECWEDMERNAESAYQADISKMQCKCSLDCIQSAGTIVLTNHIENDIPDTTTWYTFEIPTENEEEQN